MNQNSAETNVRGNKAGRNVRCALKLIAPADRYRFCTVNVLAPRIVAITLLQKNIIAAIPLSAQLAATEKWNASLTLRFAKDGAATRLSERAHEGPLRLLKPLYPEGDANCHAVIVHPPGGIVAGDALTTRVTVDERAHGVITTPGAQKWYRSASVGASADTEIRLDENALLEWMPQESIVFNGAHATQNVSIHLAPTATLFAWEIVCFGRATRDERFVSGQFSQAIRLYRNEALIWKEQTRLVGGDALLASGIGWGRYRTSATAWLYTGAPASENALTLHHDERMLAAIREALPSTSIAAASSPVPGLFVVKALGDDVESVRELLISVWSAIRLDAFALTPTRPRIWST